MFDYIVFFGMLASGLLAYIFLPKTESIVSPIDAERNKCESPIERQLYNALVARGYAVTSQVPCSKYRIDLALVGPRIAIECDGKAFHSSPKAKARDRRKDKCLKENGWCVLRFSGRRINGDLPKVLRDIEEAVNNKNALN
jgi:very-short-patch-repair endonuclease